VYPEISLKKAREHRDEAKKRFANGADPGAVKQARKAEARERMANTFEAVAGRWFEKWKTEVSASTAESQWSRLVKHIMPVLGPLPVSDIDAPKVFGTEAAGSARNRRYPAQVENGDQPDYALRRAARTGARRPCTESARRAYLARNPPVSDEMQSWRRAKLGGCYDAITQASRKNTGNPRPIIVIARATRRGNPCGRLDCHVAALLAMTVVGVMAHPQVKSWGERLFFA
jgi:hypothetical protein